MGEADDIEKSELVEADDIEEAELGSEIDSEIGDAIRNNYTPKTNTGRNFKKIEKNYRIVNQCIVEVTRDT